ncbi:hypothetical protein BC829DRAFT_386584 [Chytridium lagenaria]|nr:hypothetical protein BC829DRAFT_386584 [Chytridium lagenaria]
MSPTTIAIIVTVPVGIIALILAALVVWILDRVHIYTTPLINNPSPTSSKLSLDQWTPQDVSTFLRTCNIDEKTVILLNDSNVDGVALLYLSEKTLMGFGVKKEETRRMILGYVDTLRRHDGKNEEVLGDGRPPSYAYVNGTSG